MTLEFGNLPTKGQGSGVGGGRPAKYIQEAEQLKARPGEWAKFAPPHLTPQSRKQMTSSINRGEVRAFRDGFEAVTRGGETYVRYTGEDQRPLRPPFVEGEPRSFERIPDQNTHATL